MRELRNIKDGKVKKKQKGMMPWLVFFILAGVIAGTVIIFIISKKNEEFVVRDLPSGNIYTQKKGEEGGETAPDKGVKPETGKEGEEPESNPESFTFYKVLSSKDKEIVPLTGGDVPKTGDEQIEYQVQERMQQIEKKIDTDLGKIEKKDALFTVQVAALSHESKANEIAARLKQLGYVSYIYKTDGQDNKILYKVRVGKFASAVDGQEVAKLLKKDGYDTYVVIAE